VSRKKYFFGNEVVDNSTFAEIFTAKSKKEEKKYMKILKSMFKKLNIKNFTPF